MFSHSATPPLRHSATRRCARGSTLLELLMYIALFAIVLVAISYFAMEFMLAVGKAAAMQDVQRNGRFAVARLAIDVREADSINFGSSVFDSDSGTLSLATANAATNPTIYTVTGGVLTVQQGAGAALPLTNSKVQITQFRLENVSPNGRTQSVRVVLTAVSTDTGGTRGLTVQQTFGTTERVRKNDGYSN